jgi:hypothetical protein|eukprot:COSAG01_NODE_525_length_15926_cov_28.158021_18_plen_100_part_00
MIAARHFHQDDICTSLHRIRQIVSICWVMFAYSRRPALTYTLTSRAAVHVCHAMSMCDENSVYTTHSNGGCAAGQHPAAQGTSTATAEHTELAVRLPRA